MIIVHQGWLMGRNLAEAETLRNLFDRSFAAILQYSVNNLIFKMNVLECMIITQVSWSTDFDILNLVCFEPERH